MTDTEVLADVIVETIKAALEPRDKKIAALETRIKELEQFPPMHYDGIHVPEKAYGVGSCVTRDGSIWYAKCATCQTPGKSDDWQLAVKHGKDLR